MRSGGFSEGEGEGEGVMGKKKLCFYLFVICLEGLVGLLLTLTWFWPSLATFHEHIFATQSKCWPHLCFTPLYHSQASQPWGLATYRYIPARLYLP